MHFSDLEYGREAAIFTDLLDSLGWEARFRSPLTLYLVLLGLRLVMVIGPNQFPVGEPFADQAADHLRRIRIRPANS